MTDPQPLPPDPQTAQQCRARALELRSRGRMQAAIDLFNHALRLDPHYAPAYFNIASIRLEQGRVSEAADAWRAAIAINPDYHQAHAALGVALRRLGRLEEAIESCKTALRIKPDFADAHLNLAAALHAAHRMDEAADVSEHLLKLDPENVRALNNYANLLADTDHAHRAIQLLRQAIALEPARAELFNNLANLLKTQGKIDEAIAAYRRTLQLKPHSPAVHSNLLLALNCHPASDGGLLGEHQQFASLHAAAFEPARPRDFSNDRDPYRRLRIGYVSADFRRHATSYFFRALLAGRNSANVHAICFSDAVNTDPVTEQFRAMADEWQNTAGLSDIDLLQRIRSAGIDILVDLAGHTANNRLLLFARRAAPIQMTYLGYPNTTGLATMDYRLTDAIADPPGLTESHHSETLLRLPGGFLCYTPLNESPLPRNLPRDPPPGARRTFGTFNNFAKVTPEMIRVWAALLRGLPQWDLLIKSESLGNSDMRSRLIDTFDHHDINADRIMLLGREPSTIEHLRTYHRIDVALDTFPYNGTTTTCEALWMGVPLVTLAGRAHVSRVGASLLHQMNLDQYIASTREQYISIATSLASDDEARAAISGNLLRQRMRSSSLMDISHFNLELESVYRRIWQRWCAT